MPSLPLLPTRLEPIVTEARRVSHTDPFLMSAAIAYNVFFALIPLAFAAVAGISMLASGTDVLNWLESLVAQGLSPDIVEFLSESVNESLEAVAGMGTFVMGVSLLVALWSGSRAIYAVQKSLRLIEDVEERRAYWHTRGLGILFTFGAGVALIVAYIVLLFGGWVIEILDRAGLDVAPVTTISGLVIAMWAIGTLFAVYRWGIAVSVPRPLVSAVTVTAELVLVTWLGAILVPTFGGGGTVAALGTVGIILVWSYVVGFMVIVTPTAVSTIEMIIRGSRP